MTVQFSFHLMTLLAVFISFGFVFTSVRKYKESNLARHFQYLLFAVLIWFAGELFEFVMVPLPLKLWWLKFKFIGLVALPVFWIVSIVEYSDNGYWINLRNVLWVSSIPLVTLLIIFTNSFYQLFFTDIQLVETSGVAYLTYASGPWFLIYATYSCLLIFAGLLYLMYAMGQTIQFYYMQVLILLTGITLPWIANMLHVFGVNPFGNTDITPYAFFISGGIFLWGIERQNLLSMLPITYQHMKTEVEEGILIIDTLDRIVEANPSVEYIFNKSAEDIIGHPATSLLPDWEFLKRQHNRNGLSKEDLVIARDGDRKVYSINISHVASQRSMSLGYVAILQDITIQQSEKEKLSRSMEETQALLGEIQELNTDLEHKVEERTERLSKSLKEKEVLLKEIHHRVKNNLQVISSLLYLQSRNIEEPRLANILQMTQARVKSMAMVHENLYQSQSLSEIDLANYLRNLAISVFQSQSFNGAKVDLQFDMESLQIDMNSAISCGLIVNELVSNSLEHAFGSDGEGILEIALQSEKNGTFSLAVRDNGAGIADDFDFQTSKSLGLKLIHTLVKQLNGTIEINGTKGTSIKLVIPNHSR